MSHDAPAHGTVHHAHDPLKSALAASNFDGEPAMELPADEPRTPNWVPLLGLALFVVVGAALLAREAGPRRPEQQAAAAPAQTAAQAAPPAAAPPPRPAVAGPQPSGSARVNNMSPEAMRDLQRRVDEARKRRAETGATAAPAAPAPPR